MKKQEIVSRIKSSLELPKAEMILAMQGLIDELDKSKETKGHVARFVHVHERVIDPNMKYPKQMLICHDILLGLEKQELTLEEVKSAIGENAELLGTRQDPYRIYAFYQKRMADEGWIGREKVNG